MNKLSQKIFLVLILLLIFIAFEHSSINQVNYPVKNSGEIEKEKYSVKRVIDGDTFVLDNSKRVRLIGIDTPEMNYKKGSPDCGALEAKLKLQELIYKKEVTLKKDKSNTDRYKRLLRYVFVGDLFVNTELIKSGLARVKYYYPDISMYKEFKKLEKTAKAKKIGIWGQLCNH